MLNDKLMKSLTYIPFLIGFYFLMPLFVSSQTPVEDLSALSKKLGTLQSYDVTIDVKIFKNKGASPAFSSTGRTIKNGTSYYLNMLNKKTIIDEDLMLVVDEKQKLLLYTAVTKEQVKLMSENKIFNVDSLIKSSKSSFKYVMNTKEEKKIEILSKDEDIEKVLISINPKTSLMNSITYEYSAQGIKNTGNSKVVISYTGFLLQPKNPELFNQSKYVKKNGKQIVATGLYKNYKLINTASFANQ